MAEQADTQGPSSGRVTTASHGGNPILKAIGRISQVCGWIAAAAIVAAVFVTCHMIFVRFVLNRSTIWQTEAVVYLMVGATLIGLPYVQYLRGHVNVDLLPMLMPPALRRALAFVTLAAGMAVIAAMAWYGYEFWYVAWDWGEKSNTVWAVPLWIPYALVPIGFGLYLLQLGADMLAVAMGVDEPFGETPDEQER